MAQLETVSLTVCEYIKTRKCITVPSDHFSRGFPKAFSVYSHHTGKVVSFTVVTEDDPLFDQDGWDGEQCVYRPTEKTRNVEYAVVYNQ